MCEKDVNLTGAFTFGVKVLDAVSLEERFRTALPMLTRQIEGLKLLKKSKKLGPDSEKRVAESCNLSLLSPDWI